MAKAVNDLRDRDPALVEYLEEWKNLLMEEKFFNPGSADQLDRQVILAFAGAQRTKLSKIWLDYHAIAN